MKEKEEQTDPMAMFYVCSLCDYRCSLAIDFTHHLHSQHPDEQCFDCHHCRYPGRYATDLTNHLFSHTCGPPEMYLCPECGFKTDNLRKLRIHSETHHFSSTSFVCQTCRTLFHTLEVFLTHLSENTLTLHICARCPAHFLTKEAITKHFHTKHSGSRAYRIIKMLLCRDRKLNNYLPPASTPVSSSPAPCQSENLSPTMGCQPNQSSSSTSAEATTVGGVDFSEHDVDNAASRENVVDNSPSRENVADDAASGENVVDDAANRENVADIAASKENVVGDAAIRENVTDDAASRENVADNAASRENVMDDAGSRENVVNDTASRENVVENSASRENVADDAASRENVADDAASRENVADDAASRESVADDAASRENAVDDAASRENVADNAASRENVADDAAGRENVADDAASRENVVNDTASREKVKDDADSAQNAAGDTACHSPEDGQSVVDVVDDAASRENVDDDTTSMENGADDPGSHCPEGREGLEDDAVQEASDHEKVIDLFGSQELDHVMKGWLYRVCGSSTYVCNVGVCNRSFLSLKTVHGHIFRHYRVPVVSCTECQRGAVSVSALMSHFTQEHDGRPPRVCFLRTDKASLLNKLADNGSSVDPLRQFAVTCQRKSNTFYNAVPQAETGKTSASELSSGAQEAPHDERLREKLVLSSSLDAGSSAQKAVNANCEVEAEKPDESENSPNLSHQSSAQVMENNVDNKSDENTAPVMMKCRICPSFALARSEENALKKHVQEVHKHCAKCFMCGHCSFMYADESRLRSHTRSQHQDKPLESLSVPWKTFYAEVPESPPTSSQSLSNQSLSSEFVSSVKSTDSYSPSEDKENGADSDDTGVSDNTQNSRKSAREQALPARKRKRVPQESDSLSSASSEEAEEDLATNRGEVMKNRNAARKVRKIVHRQLADDIKNQSSHDDTDDNDSFVMDKESKAAKRKCNVVSVDKEPISKAAKTENAAKREKETLYNTASAKLYRTETPAPGKQNLGKTVSPGIQTCTFSSANKKQETGSTYAEEEDAECQTGSENIPPSESMRSAEIVTGENAPSETARQDPEKEKVEYQTGPENIPSAESLRSAENEAGENAYPETVRQDAEKENVECQTGSEQIPSTERMRSAEKEAGENAPRETVTHDAEKENAEYHTGSQNITPTESLRSAENKAGENAPLETVRQDAVEEENVEYQTGSENITSTESLHSAENETDENAPLETVRQVAKKENVEYEAGSQNIPSTESLRSAESEARENAPLERVRQDAAVSQASTNPCASSAIREADSCDEEPRHCRKTKMRIFEDDPTFATPGGEGAPRSWLQKAKSLKAAKQHAGRPETKTTQKSPGVKVKPDRLPSNAKEKTEKEKLVVRLQFPAAKTQPRPLPAQTVSTPRDGVPAGPQPVVSTGPFTSRESRETLRVSRPSRDVNATGLEKVEKGVQCPQCSQIFGCLIDFKHHSEKHDASKSSKALEWRDMASGAVFNLDGDMVQPAPNPVPFGRKYLCAYCDYRSSRRDAAENHQRTEHKTWIWIVTLGTSRNAKLAASQAAAPATSSGDAPSTSTKHHS